MEEIFQKLSVQPGKNIKQEERKYTNEYANK